jgi:predicted Zn-dependent peptidase
MNGMDTLRKRTLNNGLTAYLDPKPIGESAAYLFIDGGRYDEERPEVAHTLEHVQGVAAKAYGDCGPLKYLAPDEKNARTFPDRTEYFFLCMRPQHLRMALEFLPAALAPPDYATLEREKAAVRTELAGRDTPLARFHERVSEQYTPNHAKLATKLAERIGRLDSLTAEDCQRFWDRHYRPDNALLYLGGELGTSVKELLAPFERIPRAPGSRHMRAPWPEEPALTGRIQLEDRCRPDRTTMMELSYLTPIFPQSQTLDEYIALQALQSHLKPSGGPLYTALRDERRLCYALGIPFQRYCGVSDFSFRIATEKPEALPEIERYWLDLLDRIAREGLPADVLDIFRNRQQVDLVHDRRHFSIDALLDHIRFGLTLPDIQQAIDRLTPEAVAGAARMLTQRNYLVSIERPEKPA